jgi:O-antigen ligase
MLNKGQLLSQGISTLRAPLPAVLLLFAASAFLLPTGPAYSLVFYLTALPAICLRRGPAAPLTQPGEWAALALILFSGLTLIWGHDDHHRSWRFAQQALWTLLFVIILFRTLPDPRTRFSLGSVLICCGTANAILSLILGAFLNEGDRLHGWGITDNPILGAASLAAPYLCALSRVLTQSRRRMPYLVACVTMALFILETESRGPLLAAALATLFLCAASPIPARALAAAAALALAWMLLPAGFRQHQAAMLVARGSSHRFDIWTRSLEMIAQRPLFGHGLAANLDLPNVPGVGDITFPHDLYLSVLFYSGIAGFLLFAGLAACVTWRLAQGLRRRDQDWLWMASLWLCSLINGLTDLGQITKGPGEMWLIFWLPAGLALARPTARSGAAAALATPRPACRIIPPATA